MNEPSSHSIRSQAARIQSGEQSVHSLLDSFLERIETHNPRIHALTHLDQEDARKQALQIEETIQSGQALQNKPLLGIPHCHQRQYCAARSPLELRVQHAQKLRIPL